MDIKSVSDAFFSITAKVWKNDYGRKQKRKNQADNRKATGTISDE